MRFPSLVQLAKSIPDSEVKGCSRYHLNPGTCTAAQSRGGQVGGDQNLARLTINGIPNETSVAYQTEYCTEYISSSLLQGDPSPEPLQLLEFVIEHVEGQ